MKSGLYVLALAGVILAGCEDSLDYDLRGLTGGFSTSDAAIEEAAPPSQPDEHGIISYPGYQVAVAQNGDTVTGIAARVGLPASELARYNGLNENVPLRRGEIVVLPRRVDVRQDTSLAATVIEPEHSAGPTGTARIDVTELASAAIENAPHTATSTPSEDTSSSSSSSSAHSAEPLRHKAARGETAFSIARLYDVPLRDLAQWNGLGSDFSLREGQYLLIPIPGTPAPIDTVQISAVSKPGRGSTTPPPPENARPGPAPQAALARKDHDKAPGISVGPGTAQKRGKLAFPVKGNIISVYSKGKNDGIDIQAPPGTKVRAAASGLIAAITKTAEGVPIIVVRHDDGLLTVYANVAQVSVDKSDSVQRGQSLAQLRAEPHNYLHFEVRDGFDSIDPEEMLGS